MTGDATTALPTLTLAVAYHGSRPHAAEGLAPYLPVCNVRPDGSRPAGFAHYDDEGGFPDRNELYSELSVQRYLERHGTGDYLGLSHYRRLFVTRRFPRSYSPRTYDLTDWDWQDVQRYGATDARLRTAVGGLDWCTAPPYDVRWAGHPDLLAQLEAHHPARSLDALDAVVRNQHPSLPSVTDFLRSTRSMAFYNMFIARRRLALEYGAWLWPVLAECEAALGRPTDLYERRWAGFLAERLHAFWLTNVLGPRGGRVGHLPIAVITAATSGAGSSVHRTAFGAQGLGARAVRLAPFGVRRLANTALRLRGRG